MSVSTSAWLVAGLPARRRDLCGLGFRCCRGALAGLHRHAGDRARVRCRDRRCSSSSRARRRAPPASSRRLELRQDVGRRRPGVDPDRPAERAHGARRHRRLDAHPPLLGGLHGRRPRLRALLRLPELLRLLHAAAGPGGQLRAADRRLGVRRRRVLHADQLLVPAHDGDERRASRRSSSTWSATSASCSARSSSSATRHRSTSCRPSREAERRVRRPTRPISSAGCLLPARRRVREVRPDPAAHLAPGRHGGPDAGLRADPRRDDGHRRRLPDRAHAPALRAGADTPPPSARSSAASRCWSRPRSAWSSPTSSASSPTRRCRRSAT